MEVDAINTGKGKRKENCQICSEPSHAAKDCYWRNGKGKDNAGKTRGAGAGGKGKDVHGAKGKGKNAYAGKRDYCHETGHNKADCRKRIADEKAKGNAAIEQEGTEPQVVAKIEFADEFERGVCDDSDQFYCEAMRA